MTRPGKNRIVKRPEDGSMPFVAVIEFKFLYEAPGRKGQIKNDIAKLKEVAKHSDYCCLIYMQRLLVKEKNWPKHLESILVAAKADNNKVGDIEIPVFYWPVVREYPIDKNHE